MAASQREWLTFKLKEGSEVWIEVQGGVSLWEGQTSRQHDLLTLHTPATARHKHHV